MRSNNPVLKRYANMHSAHSGVATMSFDGAIHKTLLFIAITILTAYFAWTNVASFVPYYFPILIGTVIVTIGIAIYLAFKPEMAQSLGFVYAIAEGFLLGILSALFEALYPGIVVLAIMSTFGTVAAMLFLYKSNVFKVTDKFKKVVFGGMAAIFLIYFVSFLLSFAGISLPLIHGSGIIGIGFSVVVIIFAALMLVLDFDMIDKMVKNNAPKFMEWYGAFAILVTIVWLYVEFLRLFSKIRN
jgi:uncharacterized YccA/Bax inhibitor family protein